MLSGSIAFLVAKLAVCWRSGSVVVKLQVSAKVSTSESIGVLSPQRFRKLVGVLKVSDRLIAGSIVCWRRFCSLNLVSLSFHEKNEKQAFKSRCAGCCRRHHDHGADDGDHARAAGECGGLAHRAGKDA